MFGPARGCPGIRAWGAWAGCGHFEVVSPGVWLTFAHPTAVLGVSEAASGTNMAIASFVFFGIDLRAATNVNEEYSSEI